MINMAAAYVYKTNTLFLNVVRNIDSFMSLRVFVIVR